MRKLPFFSGIVLLLFPLNWLRLILLGERPNGAPLSNVPVFTLIFLSIAALLIWYGLPSLRPAPNSPEVLISMTSGGGWLSNFKARRKEAREQAAEREQAEERQRQLELETARIGELTPVDPGTVILHSGELAYSAIPAALLELRTVSYRGRSTGVSVRVARGVWLRQGGSRGTAEKGLVPVAQGTLVATNKRVIFTGDQKSLALPLEKITSFETLADGLRLGDAHKTYNFLMVAGQHKLLFATIADRLLRELA